MRALLDRLSPDYWWSDPTTAWDGAWVLMFTLLLATAFVVAATAATLAPRLQASCGHLQINIGRTAAWVLGFAAVGLLLVLFRWQATPFFGKRLWIILWFATMLMVVGATVLRLVRERFDIGDVPAQVASAVNDNNESR